MALLTPWALELCKSGGPGQTMFRSAGELIKLTAHVELGQEPVLTRL